MKRRTMVVGIIATNVIALAGALFDSFANRVPATLRMEEKRTIWGGQCYQTVYGGCPAGGVKPACNTQKCTFNPVYGQVCNVTEQDLLIKNALVGKCSQIIVGDGHVDCTNKSYPCYNQTSCAQGKNSCLAVKTKTGYVYYCQTAGAPKQKTVQGNYASGDDCQVTQADYPMDSAVARANGLGFNPFFY